jgi:hypothetical protein
MLLVVLLLPGIPLLFFFNMVGNMMSQFSPQGVGFHLTALWFFIIGMDLFAALLVFIPVLVAYLNCEITLTNKRLIYRTGFLVRAAGELPLENGAHLPVAGELAGLPERFQARSCGCTQHDVFRAAWYRPKRFFGCEGGWIFIRSGAVSGWHANFAWNGNG